MSQNVEAIFDQYAATLDAFKEKFTEEFLTRVQMRTPVRTGVLRDGWQGDISGDLITISNEVPYAEYIEYGTPHIAPFAMLGQTIAEVDIIAEIALTA